MLKISLPLPLEKVNTEHIVFFYNEPNKVISLGHLILNQKNYSYEHQTKKSVCLDFYEMKVLSDKIN
jgi:hypothetical protein